MHVKFHHIPSNTAFRDIYKMRYSSSNWPSISVFLCYASFLIIIDKTYQNPNHPSAFTFSSSKFYCQCLCLFYVYALIFQRYSSRRQPPKLLWTRWDPLVLARILWDWYIIYWRLGLSMCLFISFFIYHDRGRKSLRRQAGTSFVVDEHQWFRNW